MAGVSKRNIVKTNQTTLKKEEKKRKRRKEGTILITFIKHCARLSTKMSTFISTHFMILFTWKNIQVDAAHTGGG